ncbi:hypothetical protein ACQP2T_53830 [Nonomuraea sp. CA-143628]|uniref:hypothetical protein n=1 Tax=Nonomuraea sp. CA-143628 TaxID=3239997 RepID=UPI003D89C172
MSDPDKLSPPPAQGWRLESDWAGLDPEREGVTYSASKLEKLAKELEGEFTKFVGDKPGSVNDLDMKANLLSMKVAVDQIKRWEGGQTFVATVQNGHKEFTEAYREIAEKTRIAIELINAGAGIYKRVDAAHGGTKDI